jgi:hypothetical protein
MAFMKHVGRHAATGQRLVVVFMELPDEPENALVVFSDSLPDRYHQALMDAVESNEGQSAKQMYEVLSRKVFWHGGQMLTTLHTEGLLSKIPTKNIIMTPNTSTNVSLNEILEQMHKIEAGLLTENTAPVQTESRIDMNVAESKSEESRQIAQNLLVQAQLLEADAQRKREEAYKYDPSLRPASFELKPAEKPKRSKASKPKTETTESA